MKKKDSQSLSLEDLQKEKLISEIRKNNIISNFWVKLFTIVSPALTALITLFILWKLNVFEVNKKQLEIQKHDLNITIAQQKRNSLTLTNKNQKIQRKNSELTNQNSLLRIENNKLKDKEESLFKRIDSSSSQLSELKKDLLKKKNSINNLKGIVDEQIQLRDLGYKGLTQDNGLLKKDTTDYRHIIRSLDDYVSKEIKLIEFLNRKYNIHLNIDSIKAFRPNSTYKPSRAY